MDIKEFSIGQENKAVGHHPWEYARFEVVYSLFLKYISTNTGTIFDIGCGDTFFVEQLAKRKPEFTYYGIDTAFTEELIKIYKKRIQKDNIILDTNINNLKSAKSKANAVFLMDVIEHIENDVDFLKSIVTSDAIDPQTIFFITVPAYQSLFSLHDTWLGHYRRYNCNQLKNSVEKANLKVLKTGYFFSSLILPRILQLLIEKLTNKKVEDIKGIGNWEEKQPKDTIIKNTLIADYKFSAFINRSGIRLPGLSCYCICQKQP